MRDKKEKELEELTPEDAILILLYANKNKPITGKLMFVKQAFLLAKELIPQLDKKFKFYPANFGPYSKVFAKEVNKLIEKGIIKLEVKTEGGKEIFRFRLSEDAIEKAKQSFNKLPNELKFKIIRKRKGWDQLGYTGIVRFVYTKYPEYTIYSEIKGDIDGN